MKSENGSEDIDSINISDLEKEINDMEEGVPN